MKKSLILTACLILASVFLFGCGGMGCNTPTSNTLTVKPWTNTYNYEKISYGVTKYEIEYNEDGQTYKYGDIEAEGAFSFELSVIAGNIYGSEEFTRLKADSEYFNANLTGEGKLSTSAGAYSLLRMTYEITYNSNSNYNGKTDKMQSVVLFRNTNLMPVYSEKSTANTTTDNNYVSIADYVNGANKYTFNGGTTITTAISENYDNELLFYIVRAQSGLTEGISTSLKVHNSVETGVYEKEAINNLYVGVDNSGNSYHVSGIDPDKNGFISKYFEEGSVEYKDSEEKNENGDVTYYKGYVLPATLVNIQRNTQNRGTATTLFYSKTPFSYLGNTTSNVLLQTVTYEYDFDNQKLASAFVSTIDGYDIEK